MRILSAAFVLLLFVKIGISQDIIILDNPSFEGIEQCCNPPFNWNDCGAFVDETPPDVHPAKIFGVVHEPHHERNYLGLVVRDNNTWECVSTRLPHPMKAGLCYTFSIYLTRSDTYLSPTKKNPDVQTQYTIPARLRIWSGNTRTREKQILAETIPVRHLFWKEYEFVLIPDQDMDVLILEAMYAIGATPYNGHILVDHASDLVPVDCKE